MALMVPMTPGIMGTPGMATITAELHLLLSLASLSAFHARSGSLVFRNIPRPVQSDRGM